MESDDTPPEFCLGGVAEKQEDLERSFKHPALFSSLKSAMPCLVFQGSVASTSGAMPELPGQLNV
jgi:hypothetical protein